MIVNRLRFAVALSGIQIKTSFLAAMTCLAVAIGAAPRLMADYDPLSTVSVQPEQKDLTIKDEKRDREIPVRVYLPVVKSAVSVVLFSHGLGGTREGSAFLGKHWAARGYVAVFLQHPGSDDSIWKDRPIAERKAALEKAADLKNFQLRVQDVPAVIHQLEAWNKDANHILGGRLNLDHLGMSGHSFGAVTTQAVSGQTFMLGKQFTDGRIKAAVVMSPSGPSLGDPKKAFSDVKIPWMLLTGTKDNSLLARTDAQSRLVVYPALPPGGKYELVLDNAEHSVFTERALPGEKQKRNPNHHRAILAVTTAFWDTYLRNDTEAKKWLEGESVRSVLDSADQWQKK